MCSHLHPNVSRCPTGCELDNTAEGGGRDGVPNLCQTVQMSN